MTSMMRAVTQRGYGGPEVLRITELPRPVPKPHELLVRVRTTTVTPPDSAFRSGTPAMARLFTGLLGPKHIPGGGFAGEVVAVGDDVTRFSVGQRVFGGTGPSFGAHAEFVCVPETAPVLETPDAWNDGDAVAVADGALTALPFLKDEAHLEPGGRLLVNGASGSVGSAAVQIGKHLGAHVTGVCSGVNRDLVASLGADRVVDYTQQDFTHDGSAYDVVFDAVGTSTFAACRRVLVPGGIYLSTVPSPAILLQSVWTAKLGSKRAKIAFTGLSMSVERLATVTGLAESGALRPVTDRTYPFEQIREAHAYVDTGRKVGTVVVTVAS